MLQRTMIPNKAIDKPGSVTFVLLLACGVCAIAVALHLGGDVVSIGLCGVLATVLPGVVIAQRLKKWGLADPLVLFCTGFVLYHAVLPFRVAMVGGTENLASVYPVQFPDTTFVKAGLLSVISALGISFVALAMPKRTGAHQVLDGAQTITKIIKSDPAFCVGLSLYALGLEFFYLNTMTLGGFMAFYSLDRAQRYSDLASQVTYPHQACFLAAFLFLGCAVVPQKSRFKVCVLAIALIAWSMGMLLQGDRRTILNLAISLLGLYTCLTRWRVTLSRRSVAVGLTAVAVLCVFANVRLLIPRVVTHNMSVSEAVTASVEDSADFGWLLPERTELAGPYLSLLFSTDHSEKRLLGESYADSLIRLVPRFLYPGERPESLSVRFSADIQQLYVRRGTAPGWGYSPVAEAYDNFDFAGVVLVGMLWTAGFVLLSALPSIFRFGPLFFAALLPQAFNCNRSDFATVLVESTYTVILLCFGLGILTVLGGTASSHVRKPARPDQRVHRPYTA
jgi:hypothetical protein